jgi:hypothetical protein
MVSTLVFLNSGGNGNHDVGGSFHHVVQFFVFN